MALSLISRLLLRAVRIGLAPLAPLLRWAGARRPAVPLAGLPVVVHSDAGEPGPLLTQLGAALALLAAHAPQRLARLRADVPRLLVEPWSGRAGYSQRTRAIVLSPSHLGEVSALWLAAELVHEATHARLSRAGIRTSAQTLARLERRCCTEQIHFLQQLPATPYGPEVASSVAWIEACLSSDTPWYTAEAREAAIAAFLHRRPAGAQ